jgi:hypothetical protein
MEQRRLLRSRRNGNCGEFAPTLAELKATVELIEAVTDARAPNELKKTYNPRGTWIESTRSSNRGWRADQSGPQMLAKTCRGLRANQSVGVALPCWAQRRRGDCRLHPGRRLLRAGT